MIPCRVVIHEKLQSGGDGGGGMECCYDDILCGVMWRGGAWFSRATENWADLIRYMARTKFMIDLLVEELIKEFFILSKTFSIQIDEKNRRRVIVWTGTWTIKDWQLGHCAFK